MNYLGRRTYLMLALGVLFSTIPHGGAKACTTPPPTTILRLFIINVGPPLRIRLVFDPWTTISTDSSQFCSCGFRFPTAVIDTIDEVRLVETGTNNLISGFAATWASNATTSAEIENILGTGAGDDWFGFLNDLGSSVTADTEADFQVDVTLNADVTVDGLFTTLDADRENLVFSDEANSSGVPLGTHQGFVDVSKIVGPPPVPTVSEWGLVVMTLIVFVGGTMMLGRRKVAGA